MGKWEKIYIVVATKNKKMGKILRSCSWEKQENGKNFMELLLGKMEKNLRSCSCEKWVNFYRVAATKNGKIGKILQSCSCKKWENGKNFTELQLRKMRKWENFYRVAVVTELFIIYFF